MMPNSLPKILITGANGQVGSALQAYAAKYNLLSMSRAQLDITNTSLIAETISNFKPDFIINTAAYTAVDKAEAEQENCLQANNIGARNLAAACEHHQIPFLHLSTDYVFSGDSTKPYIEEDKPNPLNFYGESKLLGEQAILEECDKYIILRVSGVFSKIKTNFVKTMLALGNTKDEIQVVSDQYTCPTSAEDIAKALFKIIDSGIHTGIYHYCSTPAVSWHDFANEIINKMKQHQTIKLKSIKPIKTIEYKTAAKRPLKAILDCSKIKTVYNIEQPSWVVAINEMIS